MVGFEGTSLDADTRRSIAALAPAGIILFRRNLDTPERLADLLAELGAIRPAPLLVALDQEGGKVSRLSPWIGETPSAASLARSGTASALRFGSATGRALRALGFNVDLAPVVDLSEPDSPNGIGDRSFGTDPDAVTALAGAFLEGLQETGVAGCLKHFPGQGQALADAHLVRPRIERSIEELERLDLVPFKNLAPRAAMVMVGHAHYRSLEPYVELPATISSAVIQGLLRGRIGFAGLVLSDDMEMGAISGLEGEGADAIAALQAGCDLLLYCKNLERATRSRDTLARAAEGSSSFAQRLEEASRVVLRAASRWPLQAPDSVAWESARQDLVEAARIA